jgi:hypothetical protein
MKVISKPTGVIKHTVELTDEDVDAAVIEYIKARVVDFDRAKNVEVRYDTGCCSLYGGTVTYETVES